MSDGAFTEAIANAVEGGHDAVGARVGGGEELELASVGRFGEIGGRDAEQPYRADKADVQAALGLEDFEIVDARAPQFYTGESSGSRFGCGQRSSSTRETSKSAIKRRIF